MTTGTIEFQLRNVTKRAKNVFIVILKPQMTNFFN